MPWCVPFVVALFVIAGTPRAQGQTPQTPAPQTPAPPPSTAAPPPGTPTAAPVTAPRVLRSVKPTYTRNAMLRRLEGDVIVRAVVDVSGRVSDATIAQSLDPELDQEALKAIQQWQFAPATANGVPVNMAIRAVITFNLRNNPRPAFGAWPTGFMAVTGRRVPTAEQRVSAGDVTLTVPVLDGWDVASDKEPGHLMLLRQPQGGLFAIEPLQSVSVPITAPLSAHDLDVVSAAIVRGAGSPATPIAVGQVEAQGHTWVWVDMDLDSTQSAPAALFDDPKRFVGVHRWVFATTVGDRTVVVSCRAYVPAAANAADAAKPLEQMAADFTEFVQRLTISSR